MVLQQDKGSAPQPFDTGLPRTQSSEDVPRWLVVLGMAAACTLLVALLRYAIDLLGVVFLIILVGFSIRAVSDWLTEGESVSAWALAAVFAGLFGTAMVGFWLFGSRDMTTGALERGLPPTVQAVSDWFEAHGWGKECCSVVVAPPRRQRRERRRRSRHPRFGRRGSPQAAPEPAPASRASGSGSSTRVGKPASQASGGEAEAATASPPSAPARRSQEPSGGGTDTPTQEAASTPPVSEPVTQPAVETSTGTSTTLASSHSASAVGTSVRFTATVTAEGSGVPTGVVVFFDGDRAIGTAAVHGPGPTVTAVFATLDLAIGDHGSPPSSTAPMDSGAVPAISQTITGVEPAAPGRSWGRLALLAAAVHFGHGNGTPPSGK